MKTWQYRVVTLNTEYRVQYEGRLEDSPESDQIIQDCLNAMGVEGWELVVTLPAMPAKQSWKNNSANPWVHQFIFKRTVKNEE